MLSMLIILVSALILIRHLICSSSKSCSSVNKKIFAFWTFLRLQCHPKSASKFKHCAFIDNMKMKCLPDHFNLLFVLFYSRGFAKFS